MKIPTGKSKYALALAIVIVALIVSHGVIIFYSSSHLAASAAIVSGVGFLLIVKHLGLIGTLNAWWRRHLRRD